MAQCLVAIFAVLTIVLAADTIATHGHSPRGARISDVSVSNLNRTDVATAVDGLAPTIAAPIHIRTSSGSATFSAQELGLTFDAAATVDRTMKQPRNLWHRFLALLGRKTQIVPAITVNDAAFNTALDAKRTVLERAAVEGGAHFVTEGHSTTPVGDLPSGGMRINRTAAKDIVTSNWLHANVIDLPMEAFSPTVSADKVQETVQGAAKTYVSKPVQLNGNGASVTLSPAELGSISTFGPDGRGGLKPIVDGEKLSAVAGAKLRKSEAKPVGATFDLGSGKPRVVPSRDGRTVDWVKTGEQLAAGAIDPSRKAQVAYTEVKPGIDTAKAKSLGVVEPVSDFTTGGFTSASGENIRLVAQEVNGAIVLPGAKFSLNNFTGPRGKAQGYVDSTIINHGRPAKAVGGGISQFATTLYNASYFAGLEDVTHTEHNYYISRYPEAREATVFEGAIDLVFKNNTPHGIYIETQWTSSSVMVRFWSTKTVEVQSITGERTAYTDPQKIELPKGDDCMASAGHKGFTTSNTRVVTDLKTGAERSRHTRTVKYDPEPNVICK